MTNLLRCTIGIALCVALGSAATSAEVGRPSPFSTRVEAIDVAEASGGVEVSIRGTRAPTYTVFKLQDPPRLVVDLASADVSGVASRLPGKGAVREITTAQYKDEKSAVGRIVIVLDGQPRYEVAAKGDAVLVTLRASGDAAPRAASPAPARHPAETAAPVAQLATAATATTADVVNRHVDEANVPHTATAVTSVRKYGRGVKVGLDGQVARFEVLELASPPRLVLDLYGVSRLPRTAVPLDGTFRQARFGKDAGKVRVVLDAASSLPRCEVQRVPGGLAVEPARTSAMASAASDAPAVTTPDAEPVAEAPRPRTTVMDAQAAGAAAEAASANVSTPVQRRDYAGRRITLDFHDIDIRNLLRLIADVSKKNLVVADDVQGKVTVSLRNVPWDQALDLVLRSKGLDKEEMGSVIRIAKIEAIAKEQQARFEAAKARAPLIPLKVRLLPVNHARANDVASRVKDVLSERGTISTDERTNVLIVKDIPEALSRAEGLVRNLDTETPQVRIESRIVEASSNFNRAIGVQWGGNATASAASGNATGLFFPNTVGMTGAAGGGPSTGTSASPNYAVNLPAAIGQGQGGGVGFTFGSAGGAFNLNLRLSALENSGVVKTISSPSVSTVDNKEATIGQGISIPFSQVSAAGVNTVFVEAKLELKVTPHVSADGSVLMKIKVTNNQPNPQLTGANGQPSISKREAETEALVKDGETTVIGGIYTRQTSNKVAEVPFLGKIPILGWFFRNTTENDDHTELLIFITPRILNRPTASGAAAMVQEPGGIR